MNQPHLHLQPECVRNGTSNCSSSRKYFQRVIERLGHFNYLNSLYLQIKWALLNKFLLGTIYETVVLSISSLGKDEISIEVSVLGVGRNSSLKVS